MAIIKKKNPKINVGEYAYADLMPISRKTAIERGQARSKWIKIVIQGAVVAVILCVGAIGFRGFEQVNYNNAMSEQEKVEAQIKTHAEVDRALTLRDLLKGNILKASSSAINWQDLLHRVSSNLPEDSTLSSFQVETGGTSTEEGSPTAAILVTVSSLQPIAYSQVLESFGKVPGLIGETLLIGDMTTSSGTNADGNEVTVYLYPVAFNIDQTILANIFGYLNGESEEKEEIEVVVEPADDLIEDDLIEEELTETETDSTDDDSIVEDEDSIDEDEDSVDEGEIN